MGRWLTGLVKPVGDARMGGDRLALSDVDFMMVGGGPSGSPSTIYYTPHPCLDPTLTEQYSQIDIGRMNQAPEPTGDWEDNRWASEQASRGLVKKTANVCEAGWTLMRKEGRMGREYGDEVNQVEGQGGSEQGGNGVRLTTVTLGKSCLWRGKRWCVE